MRSSDDYLTDIITRRIIFSPTDEYFWAHGWMDTDFAMLMFFLNTNFSNITNLPCGCVYLFSHRWHRWTRIFLRKH